MLEPWYLCSSYCCGYYQEHAHDSSSSLLRPHHHRLGVVSLELFDSTPRDFSVLDYLFNPNNTQPVSSFDASPLEVVSQAFWSRTPARFLSVTSTGQGITSRQLLVGTHTDQVGVG